MRVVYRREHRMVNQLLIVSLHAEKVMLTLMVLHVQVQAAVVMAKVQGKVVTAQ